MNSIDYQIFDICGYHYLNPGYNVQLDVLFVKKTSKYIPSGILY
jgi:hypothetical protein